jgi:thiol-disulfide isomerase/thioredoxin
MSINVTLYHANWCGHCQEFMPEWKKFEKEMETNSKRKVTVNSVEESSLSRSDMPKINGKDIRGFPTIKITNGDKEINYDGKRTAKDLIKYLDNI